MIPLMVVMLILHGNRVLLFPYIVGIGNVSGQLAEGMSDWSSAAFYVPSAHRVRNRMLVPVQNFGAVTL